MQRQLVALLLAALCCRPCTAFKRSDWTLNDAGFEIEPYAAPGAVPSARSLATGGSKPNGPWITYVSSMSFNPTDAKDITALVDLTGRGEADFVQVIVAGLSAMPNGITYNGGDLFIASMEPYKSCKIWRLPNVDSYAVGRKVATRDKLQLIRDDLPFDFWHGWKFIRFGPDGALYIPIGANCNACRLDGTPPNNGYIDGKAIYNTENSGNVSHVTAPFTAGPGHPVWEFGSIYRMARDGTNIQLVARGVRNTVGFDWHPVTKKLFFTDNGRDNWDLQDSTRTDNRPDCELNVVAKEGSFFGFPFCHTGPTGGNVDYRPYLRPVGVGPQLVDPDLNANESVMKCNGPAGSLQFVPAIQAMGPHTAPLGMRFYRWFAGANFPQSYDKSILIAQHGSWNRNRPIGARVMRVTLNAATPLKVATFTPFLSGGVPNDKGNANGPVPLPDRSQGYNGRPVDVEQLPDGSLLVSDDAAGSVYRVSYSTPTTCRGAKSNAIRKKEQEHEDDGEDASLAPAAIPGTANGCRVNQGLYGAPLYRRCYQADASKGAGRKVQLATSLVNMGGTLVLRGALLLPKFACTVSAAGWVGFGLPKEQGSGDMKGASVFITRPAPATDLGAVATDYYLASTSLAGFKTTSGFLKDKASLKAMSSGGALVTTFDIILPPAFQTAAKNAGKLAISRKTRPTVAASTPSKISFIMAMGDTSSTGQMQRHYFTAKVSIPFSLADVGAAVPADSPVINRGAGPREAPPPSPPPPASPPPPPSPPPSPFSPCAANEPCCLNGVRYDACQTDSKAGAPITQYYNKVAGGRLEVAIKATTSGWVAWMFNDPANQGVMVGGNALFLRPCASCATGVSTVSAYLGSYVLNGFTASRLAFNPTASGTAPGGVIWASFSLPWPGGAAPAIRINYGTGTYTAGSPTGVDGMAKHSVTPPTACVASAGTMPATC